MPMATSKGTEACALDHPNASWLWIALAKTLHAYTAPMASCTSTPATRMSHRLPPGEAVLSFRTAFVLMRLPFSSRWSGASARRRDRVVDDAGGTTLLEPLTLRLDGVLRVDRRDHAGLEDAEAGAHGGRHEGSPAQRRSDPVAAEGDGADGTADRQRPAGLEQASGLAGAQRLRQGRPQLVLHALEGDELGERADGGELARRAVLTRGNRDEGETGGREVGGADEDEGQLAVGLVPRRGGRVGEQDRRVGGQGRREDRGPHGGRPVRELERLGQQGDSTAGSSCARTSLEHR